MKYSQTHGQLHPDPKKTDIILDLPQPRIDLGIAGLRTHARTTNPRWSLECSTAILLE